MLDTVVLGIEVSELMRTKLRVELRKIARCSNIAEWVKTENTADWEQSPGERIRVFC